jgi:KDO2-lipid IV(A) lauroyltransferase
MFGGFVVCGRFVADRLGDAAYLALPRYRRAAAANLARVLGEPSDSPAVRAAVRGAFRASVRNFLALAVLRVVGRLWSPALVVEFDAVAPETLRGPVVIVSAHLGPFDVVAALLARHGHSFVVVGEPMRPRWLDRCVRWLRGQGGVALVPASREGLWRIRQALGAARPVVFLVDRRVDRGGRLVRFFGAPACLPEAPLRLAHRWRCPLVPAFAFRTADGYRVRLGTPIALDGARERMREACDELVTRLEAAIRASPDQWLVFQPVWRD